jgi:hypothetical protein
MGATGGPNSTGSTDVAYDDVYLGSYVPTSTIAGASPNPAAIKQKVDYIVTVRANSGSGAPSGLVTFFDNGNVIPGCANVRVSARPNPLEGIGADCSNTATTYATPGKHQIEVDFEGDAAFGSSTATFTQQVVIPPTTISLDASQNPAFGPTISCPTCNPPEEHPWFTTVTYTAAVADQAPFGPLATPSGTVTFTLNGVIPLCPPVALDSIGHASCTYTWQQSLLGQQPVVATYSGDSQSTSATVTQNMTGSEFPNPQEAGYLQLYPQGPTYTGIKGTWTVPAILGTTDGCGHADDNHAKAKSSTWIGIGGPGFSNLLQIGTIQDLEPDNSTHYSAFWEMIPGNASQTYGQNGFGVCPGDTVTATITEQAPNHWVMAMTNDTTGLSGGPQTVDYTPGNYLQAVLERSNGTQPDSGPFLPALSQPIVFQNVCYATSTPKANSTAGPAWAPFFNLPPSSAALPLTTLDVADMRTSGLGDATTSAIDANNDGFTIQNGDSRPDPPVLPKAPAPCSNSGAG